MFKGDLVYIRPLEPSDATHIMLWENNESDWQVSGTEIPYSLHSIMEFIEQAQHFRQTGQLRLMICDLDDQPLGLLDFFHANFKHHFTSIGILIANDKRQLGYATDALKLGVNYARKVFDFNNIFASIHESNEASLNLFKKTGFEQIGLRKNCFKFDGKYSNEVLLQLEIE